MKILLVAKQSNYERNLASKDPRVHTFLQSHPKDLQRKLLSHEVQNISLEKIVKVLERSGHEFTVLHRSKLKDMIRDSGKIQDYDLVVAHGGDGTTIEVSHYVDDIPVIGVNSDHKPGGSVGFFSVYNSENFEGALENLYMLPKTKIRRLAVSINDNKLKDYVFNEAILQYVRPGPSFDFILNADGVVTKHRPTYFLMVATPAGSTGGIYALGGKSLPFESYSNQYAIVGERGNVPAIARNIEVESLCEKGIISIDSHYRYFFGLGDKIKFEDGIPLTLIGDLSEKKSKFENGH
jgi:NAD kinase